VNLKRFPYLAVLLFAAHHPIAWAQNPNPQPTADQKATVETVHEMDGNACGKEIEDKHTHGHFWNLAPTNQFYIKEPAEIQQKLEPITETIDEEMKKPVFYSFNEAKAPIKKHPCMIRTSFEDFPFTFAIADLQDTDNTQSPHILIIVPARMGGANKFYLLVSSVRTMDQCNSIPWYHPIIKDSCKKMRELTDMQSNVSTGRFFQEIMKRMDDIRWALVPVKDKMHNGVIHGNL